MNIKITELLKEAKELDESFLITDIKELEKLIEDNKATVSSVAFKRLQAKIRGIVEAQLVADVKEADAEVEETKIPPKIPPEQVSETTDEIDDKVEYDVVYSETDDEGTLEIAEVTNLDEVGEETNVQVEVKSVPEPVQDEAGADADVAEVEAEQDTEIDDEDGVLEIVEIVEIVNLGGVDVEATYSFPADTATVSEDTATVSGNEVIDDGFLDIDDYELDVIHSSSPTVITAVDEAHMLDVSCAEVALKEELDNLGSVNDADHFERGEAIDTQLIALEVANALDIVKRVKDNVGKPVSIDEAESAAEIVSALRDDEIVSHVNIAKLAVVNAKNVQVIRKSNNESYRDVIRNLATSENALYEARKILENLIK